MQKTSFLLGESAKKLLQPELQFLAEICIQSSVGWSFIPDPIKGAYITSWNPSWLKGVSQEGERGGTVHGWGKGEGGSRPTFLNISTPLLHCVVEGCS